MVIVGASRTCQSSCPSATYLSITSNLCITCGNNCLVCTSATTCTTCNNSTSLYLGYCISTCPAGYTSVSNVCTACQTGCKICSDLNTCTNCNSGLTNDNNGTCSYSNNITCSAGYYPNTLGNCSQCYPTCKTCSGNSVSDCLTCYSGATFSNGICTTNCNTDSYYSTSAGSCVVCSTTYTNCASCT